MSQAELPSRGPLVSRLSPYALAVLEGCAARTSAASGVTPLWLPETARAFILPLSSACSSLHLALFDEVVREEAVREEAVARAREGREGEGKGPSSPREAGLEAVREAEMEAEAEAQAEAEAAVEAETEVEAQVEAEAGMEPKAEAEVVQEPERPSWPKPPPPERRSEGSAAHGAAHGAGPGTGHASMGACLAEALSEAKDMAKDLAKEAKGLAKEGLKGVDRGLTAVATEAKKGGQGLSRAVVGTLARPAMSFGKKVKEGARDRPLGRLVLELRLLRHGHTYDGWLPLELHPGEFKGRATRGFVRLRYSITWAAPLPMLRRALRPPPVHALGFESRRVIYTHACCATHLPPHPTCCALGANSPGVGRRRAMRVAQFAVEGGVDEHDFSWRIAQACGHSRVGQAPVAHACGCD